MPTMQLIQLKQNLESIQQTTELRGTKDVALLAFLVPPFGSLLGILAFEVLRSWQ